MVNGAARATPRAHRVKPTDLANFVGGTPERFVPELMSGDLIEPEHVVRYWWAAGHATDRYVLDAGCGLGYGSAILAAGGAKRVAGVDLAPDVIEAAASTMPSTVELTVGDVHELPFQDATFDLVVCFEVLEHVGDGDGVLDELARVANDGALVVVSSPNRDAYVPGNPHHRREYGPDELRDALAARFGNVAALRQHDAAISLLLTDDGLEATGRGSLPGDGLGKTFAIEPGREPYVVAVASDAALPELAACGCVSDPMDVRRWVERFAAQQQVLDGQAEELADLQALRSQVVELTDLLRRSEQGAARSADSKQLEEHAARLANDLARARAAAQALKASPSWRLTAPLRGLKGRVGRGQ